jgi:hypothetical protein
LRRWVVRCSAISLGVLPLAVGCGAESTKQTFGAADLQRITSVRPMTSHWDWPQAPSSSGQTSRSELEPTANDRLTAALDRKLSNAGFVRSQSSKWQDETKLGHLDGAVFESASGAHHGLAALRAFAHGWAERFGGDFTDIPVKGLGEESSGIWEHLSYGSESVTYHWRRGNLVVEVHIQCFQAECPSDIRRAARSWAVSVDEEAQNSP